MTPRFLAHGPRTRGYSSGMSLVKEMERSGQWLFRWRSYLPLVFLPVSLGALAAASEPAPVWARSLGIGISLLGLGVRIWVAGWAPAQTSGRNTRKQVADRLNTQGPYSVARHPLYLGNYGMFAGILIWTGVLWVWVLGSLSFWLYYERIMAAEEGFLDGRFRGVFRRWAAKTPAFWPRILLYQPGSSSWIVRAALKREYSSYFAWAATLSFLRMAEAWFQTETLGLPRSWWIFFGLSLGIYLTLRTLKRHTRVLEVRGR